MRTTPLWTPTPFIRLRNRPCIFLPPHMRPRILYAPYIRTDNRDIYPPFFVRLTLYMSNHGTSRTTFAGPADCDGLERILDNAEEIWRQLEIFQVFSKPLTKRGLDSIKNHLYCIFIWWLIRQWMNFFLYWRKNIKLHENYSYNIVKNIYCIYLSGKRLFFAFVYTFNWPTNIKVTKWLWISTFDESR